jgi:glycosyltransferase involved in cell wall biosynthesis
MPDLLRCCDIFVLTSTFEMMPIALLEAIATGLPVITNNHPVLEWMGGPGGIRPDMSKEGALAETLTTLTAEEITNRGKAARQHALNNYSETAVINQYLNYYEKITPCG